MTARHWRVLFAVTGCLALAFSQEPTSKAIRLGDPARLERLRAAKMPPIKKPIEFFTPEADAILSALEVFPPDNPWNLLVEDWPLHPNSKNIIQSILHAHLIPSCPAADLCGSKRRAWLNKQILPEDERLAVERHLREFDRRGHRCLQRHGISRLPETEGDKPARKKFKSCPIGYFHIDIAEVRPAIGTRSRPPWSDHQARTLPAAFWSRRLGPPPERLGPCELSFCGSGRNAANIAPRWRRLASSPS